jgi:hypothetical protein
MFPHSIQFGGVNADHLIDNITEKGRHLTDTAHAMLCAPSFGVSPADSSGNLLIVDPGNIGLVGNKWQTQTVFNRLKKIGHDLCPSDLVPKLFLGLTAEDLGFNLIVAMKPIETENLVPQIFVIEKRYDTMSKLWLTSMHFNGIIVHGERLVCFHPNT